MARAYFAFQEEKRAEKLSDFDEILTSKSTQMCWSIQPSFVKIRDFGLSPNFNLIQTQSVKVFLKYNGLKQAFENWSSNNPEYSKF